MNVVGELDVAMLCVVAFVLFFLGLIYHLRQEDKREGYPLEMPNAVGGLRRAEGFPPVPKPKFFQRPHGRGLAQAPRAEDPPEPVDWRQGLNGFPIDTGPDPLGAGLGAAAWQRGRADEPDLNIEGEPKIVPLSVCADYYVAPGDIDLRDCMVVSADGETVGRVVDLWFNRAEFFLRYLEVDIGDERTRMMPLFLSDPDIDRGVLRAHSLTAADFRRIPVTGLKDIITMREEEMLSAYFAGGLRFSAGARLPGLGRPAIAP